MNFNTRYHPKSFLPKLFLGKALYGLFEIPFKPGDLLVLNYHSTPEWLMPEFEKQVQFFLKHFNLVTPSWLDSFYNESAVLPASDKPSVLFTFDDGLKNNLYAARVLEKFNSTGLFFLVPQFLGSPVADQKSYYMQNIRKRVNFNIDTTEADVTALTEIDINLLLRNGHRIGCHSLSHTMHRNDDKLKSTAEIIKSKAILEEKFKVSVVDFCAPFDSLRSTNKDQMELIKTHYQFFHSTFPGSNSDLPDRFFIRRANVECWWPLDVVKFTLSDFEWARWKPKRNQFRKEVLGI